MSEPAAAPPHEIRSPHTMTALVRRRPITAYLVLVFAVTGLLAVPPIPELMYGALENILGAAVPAFVVTAVVGGRAGVRDLVSRSLRWRVPLRWYAVSLLALPTALLLLAPALYGTGPLGALAENWPLLFTSFLPTLAFLVVFNNVAEESAWTGFLFARLQERHAPLRAALMASIPFCLWHMLSFIKDSGSLLTGAALTAYLLLPLVATRVFIGWLYNASGASVLIGGLFHAMHNATVNPTGLAVAVLDLPQGEVLFLTAVLVLLAGVVVAVATHGRLGVPGPRSSQTAGQASSRPSS
jgi:uncharacterized protein